MGAIAAVEPDTELMLRLRDGDDTSFTLLLDRHRTPLITYLWRMTHNQAVAEELAQETFLRVYQARRRYEPSARFATWLYRIATNLAINSRRNGRSAGESLDAPLWDGRCREIRDHRPVTEELLLVRSRVAEIRRAIADLPPNQRAAVLMHKYEEMSYCQIAGALAISEGAVKSLLFRAYEKLRTRLAHLK